MTSRHQSSDRRNAAVVAERIVWRYELVVLFLTTAPQVLKCWSVYYRLICLLLLLLLLLLLHVLLLMLWRSRKLFFSGTGHWTSGDNQGGSLSYPQPTRESWERLSVVSSPSGSWVEPQPQTIFRRFIRNFVRFYARTQVHVLSLTSGPWLEGCKSSYRDSGRPINPETTDVCWVLVLKQWKPDWDWVSIVFCRCYKHRYY